MNAAISATALTKHYGTTLAVDDLTFDVARGTVTALLGPNGAGKSTTMRMVLGLVRPTSGSASVLGVPYAHLRQPMRAIGALLDEAGFHPGRTARDQLRIAALGGGIAPARIDEVLELVELSDVAHRRVGGFSLGMRRRLGLACALLGDPQVVVLDEPANGLDPAGIRWLRGFLRTFAAQGRTVLLSTHLLPEAAQLADDVVIVAHGRLVAQAPLSALAARAQSTVRVRTPDWNALRVALADAGLSAAHVAGDELRVDAASTELVGRVAAAHGIPLYENAADETPLEELFLSLTAEAAA